VRRSHGHGRRADPKHGGGRLKLPGQAGECIRVGFDGKRAEYAALPACGGTGLPVGGGLGGGSDYQEGRHGRTDKMGLGGRERIQSFQTAFNQLCRTAESRYGFLFRQSGQIRRRFCSTRIYRFLFFAIRAGIFRLSVIYIAGRHLIFSDGLRCLEAV